jgi:hypothetical protein
VFDDVAVYRAAQQQRKVSRPQAAVTTDAVSWAATDDKHTQIATHKRRRPTDSKRAAPLEDISLSGSSDGEDDPGFPAAGDVFARTGRRLRRVLRSTFGYESFRGDEHLVDPASLDLIRDTDPIQRSDTGTSAAPAAGPRLPLSLQEWACRRVLAGRSSLVVAATGTGKSLCYQLPALLMATAGAQQGDASAGSGGLNCITELVDGCLVVSLTCRTARHYDCYFTTGVAHA